jgi:hypothetical protein
MGQGGCHQHKIAGEVDVHLLHPFQIFQVLRGNLCNGDVVNIHFGFFDQMDQQVHGTFENILEPDPVKIVSRIIGVGIRQVVLHQWHV